MKSYVPGFFYLSFVSFSVSLHANVCVLAKVDLAARNATLAYWTNEKIAAAQSADFLVDDDTTNGYEVRRVGDTSDLYYFVLTHTTETGGSDRERRELQLQQHQQQQRQLDTIVLKSPATGETFVSPRAVTFKAIVGSPLGLSFVFQSPDGEETVVVADEYDDVTSTVKEIVGGFTDGEWTWWVAYDASGVTSAIHKFTISTFEGSARHLSPTSNLRRQRQLQTNVAMAIYEGDDQVKSATGMLIFAVNGRNGYKCSGTVIKDSKTGRSLILTAAHCIWHDISGTWVTNAIFIPKHDDGEPCGRWALSGGVVPKEWQTTPWPKRLAYDYGFYVVDDENAHSGAECGPEGSVLDSDVPDMELLAGGSIEDGTMADNVGEFLHAFGYPWNSNRLTREDGTTRYRSSDFSYCAQAATRRSSSWLLDSATGLMPSGAPGSLWMGSCGMLGGASGGPIIKNFDKATGSGQIISVNSWGSGRNPGMGSVMFDATITRCLVNTARDIDFDELEGTGMFAECYTRICDSGRTSRRLGSGRILCEKNSN